MDDPEGCEGFGSGSGKSQDLTPMACCAQVLILVPHAGWLAVRYPTPKVTPNVR